MRTTAKHFEIFKKECERWQKAFGLLNWEFNFYHSKEDERSIATTECDNDNRVAFITLNTGLEDVEITNYEIKKSAFHEVMEVLLYSIRYIAEERYVNECEIDTEIHNIIRTLEHVVFEEMQNGKSRVGKKVNI